MEYSLRSALDSYNSLNEVLSLCALTDRKCALVTRIRAIHTRDWR